MAIWLITINVDFSICRNLQRKSTIFRNGIDEEMYKRFRNFVNDDGRGIYRYQNKSEEEKSKFSQCPNCSRKYLRIGSLLAAFGGCKNAKSI